MSPRRRFVAVPASHVSLSRAFRTARSTAWTGIRFHSGRASIASSVSNVCGSFARAGNALHLRARWDVDPGRRAGARLELERQRSVGRDAGPEL